MAHGGKATLIDLSIARPPGEVRSGFGTPSTWPPSRPAAAWSRRRPTVGPGSDVYAAATGVPPLPDLRPVRSLRPRLHPALAAVVDACLSPAPADRPAMAEIHERLGSVLD